MISLAELRRFQLVDGAERPRRLVDLVVDELDHDYPRVAQVLVHGPAARGRAGGPRPLLALPWSAVKQVEAAAQRLHVPGLGKASPLPDEALRGGVLLRRDVLDEQLIDLQNRRARRANDLMLQVEPREARLCAADTGLRAILRRLSRGRLGGRDQADLIDWKYVEFLRGDPGAVRAGKHYRGRIVHLPPGEIANLSSLIPYLHAAELLMLLPPQLAADTLEVLPAERQLQVFEELDERQALAALGRMAPDAAADLVGRLETALARRYLNRLPRQRAERIVELLRYPEDTVGGIMTNDVVMAAGELTVAEARQQLRERLKGPDFVYFVYVVEDEATRKLRGVVSLRDLLTAGDDRRLEALMNPYLVTLAPLDSPREAAYRLLASQLAALPVVGQQGRLLGAVTVDAAVRQVAPRSWSAQAPRVFS